MNNHYYKYTTDNMDKILILNTDKVDLESLTDEIILNLFNINNVNEIT